MARIGNMMSRQANTPLTAWSVTELGRAATPTARHADCVYLYGVPVPRTRPPARGICGQLSDEGYTCDRPLLHTGRCHATLMVNNRLYVVAVWPA